MKAFLSPHKTVSSEVSISINGSKSESNRLLILQAFYPNLRIENLSDSEDTCVLQKGLGVKTGTVNVNHAGSTMRFLTAYFSSLEGAEIVLTGSSRMQQRPIKILVDALRKLGADIQYENKIGFPPLKIKGKKLNGSQISLDAGVSSQYISALMLIAPSFENEFRITLNGKITSFSYLQMTASILEKIGIFCSITKNIITIKPAKNIANTVINVESDWSSASYFYSLVALSENSSITLKKISKDSRQGDRELVSIYEKLGVQTVFNATNESITLSKSKRTPAKSLFFDLSDTPDIAQTIAVTCFGLKLECELRGLRTLKIKETDRLSALKSELEKLGAEVSVTEDSFKLFSLKTRNQNVEINTFNDHRMAMAFAPLAIQHSIVINDSEVVKKSFPTFWQCLEKAGVAVNFQ